MFPRYIKILVFICFCSIFLLFALLIKGQWELGINLQLVEAELQQQKILLLQLKDSVDISPIEKTSEVITTSSFYDTNSFLIVSGVLLGVACISLIALGLLVYNNSVSIDKLSQDVLNKNETPLPKSNTDDIVEAFSNLDESLQQNFDVISSNTNILYSNISGNVEQIEKNFDAISKNITHLDAEIGKTLVHILDHVEKKNQVIVSKFDPLSNSINQLLSEPMSKKILVQISKDVSFLSERFLNMERDISVCLAELEALNATGTASVITSDAAVELATKVVS